MSFYLNKYLLKIVFTASLILTSFSSIYADEWGQYRGKVEARWSDDGRSMTLLKDFSYVSPDGEFWIAPVDSVIDGASIPRLLWVDVGSPFVGKYREASVIHDVACDVREKPWKDVHEAFYTAMRASGVGAAKARIMYAGVYFGGPRWKLKSKYKDLSEEDVEKTLLSVRSRSGEDNRILEVIDENDSGRSGERSFDLTISVIPNPPKFDFNNESYEKIKKLIESNDMSLSDIRNIEL